MQVMVCRLFGTKPLPEPMFTYCRLDPQEQISVKFESKYKAFHSTDAFECIICNMSVILFSPKHDQLQTAQCDSWAHLNNVICGEFIND